MSALSSLSPARKQYLEFKKQFPDAILMYQVGDFFETFDEDAYITARELQIVRTTRSYSKGKERVPLAGIPVHALDNYVGKLIQRGYKVVICEQQGEAKGRDVVERAVTRILTAGTLSEPDLLPVRQNNYLVSIAPGRQQTGLAAVDVSTGEFMVTWFRPDELPLALDAELQRLAPVECLLVENSDASSYQFPSHNLTVTYCPPYFYQQEAAQQRLCRLFGVQSLEAYGCAREPQAIAAAGAIVAYLDKMNPSLLSLLTALYSYRTDNYMVLDAHTQRNLELLQGARSGSLQGSLLGVLDRTITPMGARQMRRTITQPLLDLQELQARLRSVEELYENPAIRSRFSSCLQELGDLERVSGRIRQGTAVRNEVLGLREYLAVLPTVRDLLQSCEAPLLLEMAEELDPCPQVSALIGQALLGRDEEGEEGDEGRLIRPGYHAELDALYDAIRDSRRWMISLELRERQRTGIRALKVGFNKVFGYYIEVSNANLKFVPDDYMRKQTLVNAERYITPELKEHEARILSAVEHIEEMERGIYADVLRQLAMHYQALMTSAALIARLDVLLSFAEVAAHQGYVRPVLEQGQRLDILGGRHPVVEYTLDGDVFIPNDTHQEAEQGERILLLTGPNMAGKSTYLRQVALIALLAQIGSFVPARQARIGLVDRIFTRVGAEDDIASGKSTFMVEMEETATILHHATSHSLIILDEIGRGTSTYDGLAIARAVVEYLHNEVKARTLFATHYHELAVLTDELEHLRVYTVAISEDEQSEIVFLHRVVPGCATRSFGVHVAKLAGMPPSLVQRAEKVLQQLETGKHIYPVISSERPEKRSSARIAETSAPYYAQNGAQPVTPSAATFAWQSAEARSIALLLEQEDQEAALDTIDVYAITPLDALNLLFLRQKKKRSY
ncbi:DNA mismatch repair protein MutS [Dictyobacter arantiisoli]|uniref:DNA mismatch repair protein MutS n=1 Tax=Dictyobacter arantiisoli TaxID=2014874 RepID=A0A5A5TBK3_9CHLR|nr:DNA mismatch repair protein MutS [Dictyobacter arantiisoli]GCF08861.1 DNA mismatch repair protein MutS [Dictyobacter arantiisoli]